jgi:hypothetical protein
MLITKISYRRTKSLPGYNSETLELTADVDSDEDVSQAINDLANIVLDHLDIPIKEPEPPKTLGLPQPKHDRLWMSESSTDKGPF